MNEAFRQGNYKDAYEGFRKLALDPQNNARPLGDDLSTAVLCLENLDRADEIDALLEDAVKIHPDDWWLLWHAAQNSMSIPHQGFIVAGKFYRGNHRGGGRMVNSVERDRVRALRWMVQAMPLALKDENHAEAGDFFLALANMLLGNRGHADAWRLQYLTDLSVLPDYDEGWMYYRPDRRGAGRRRRATRSFTTVPKSFAAAHSDGQRWRWCLHQAGELNPQKRDDVQMQFAEFLWSQFGVQTMAECGLAVRPRGRPTTRLEEQERHLCAGHASAKTRPSPAWPPASSVSSCPTSSTTSSSIRRSPRHPQVRPFRRGPGAVGRSFREPAAVSPGGRLLADAGQGLSPRVGPRGAQTGSGGWIRSWATGAASSRPRSQPAGRGATVDYRFRNGRQVEFIAYEIKVEKLLDDVKAILKSNPQQLDWRQTNIDNIGYRLVEENQRQYLGRQVARWQMTLNPRQDHFDRRVTVTTPLATPGAYLLQAKMGQGNTCFIILWIDDTAIVKKPLEGKSIIRRRRRDRPAGAEGQRRILRLAASLSQRSAAARSCHQAIRRIDRRRRPGRSRSERPADAMQWLITARTPEGRFAYLGFTGVWYGHPYDAQYNATKVYAITDRPVYRPEQKVHYKFWIRHAQYDMPDGVGVRRPASSRSKSTAPRARRSIRRRRGPTLTAASKASIPCRPTPRWASMGCGWPKASPRRQFGGGNFRVEEYKKPEFEVTVDAPAEPVMLGEKITATIKAKYYFGSPVTKAKVKYTVNRSAYNERWYPAGPWDWLYGAGYWWFGDDYDWYPGWRRWGCPRPVALLVARRPEPPELVAEQEVEIGPDGTVKVEIDTAVAKAIHPDQDHSYTITAEVIDQSRRTIVGTGTVLVARQPFKVYAWLDRGYYRVGDAIDAHFAARTLDGRPVHGKGELRLLRITYKAGQPVETPVQTWPLDTDAEGTARQQMTASQAGQYRLSYKLTRGEGRGLWASTAVRPVGKQ